MSELESSWSIYPEVYSYMNLGAPVEKLIFHDGLKQMPGFLGGIMG